MPRSQSRRPKAKCTQKKKRSASPIRGVSHFSRRAKRRLYCKLQLWLWRKRRERCGSWILSARTRARKLGSASLLRMKIPLGKNKSSAAPPVECNTADSEDGHGCRQKSLPGLCESGQNAVTDTDVSEGNTPVPKVAQLSPKKATKATTDSPKKCPSVKPQNGGDACELTPHFKKPRTQVQTQRPEDNGPSGHSPTVSAGQDVTANGGTDESKSTASLQGVISLQVLKKSIHEFLDDFYRVYGSFIPLQNSSVLTHLRGRFKTDLTDRTSVIFAEVNKCKSVITQSPAQSFQIVYKKHKLTLEDLSTLADQNWLNDQVMNMYGELIMESAHHKIHFLNSFFHRQLMTKGYDGVKRWTKQVDLFSKRLLLVPIHLEVHWCLVSADIVKKKICLYDSQGISLLKVARNILRYLITEAKEKKQTAFEGGWTVVHDEKVPQQTNENDCGVFVLEYSRRLAQGKALLFSQKDIPMIRKRIYKELCDCELCEES